MNEEKLRKLRGHARDEITQKRAANGLSTSESDGLSVMIRLHVEAQLRQDALQLYCLGFSYRNFCSPPTIDVVCSTCLGDPKPTCVVCGRKSEAV